MNWMISPDRAADYYQKQVDALVERMTTLIEPLLILLVGAVIALMVVLTYLPVFHLGSALQSDYKKGNYLFRFCLVCFWALSLESL